MDQIKIGEFIAKERKRKGLTQQQLADILGISNKAVSSGNAVMAYLRFHYCYRFVQNWRSVLMSRFPEPA